MAGRWDAAAWWREARDELAALLSELNMTDPKEHLLDSTARSPRLALCV